MGGEVGGVGFYEELFERGVADQFFKRVVLERDDAGIGDMVACVEQVFQGGFVSGEAVEQCFGEVEGFTQVYCLLLDAAGVDYCRDVMAACGFELMGEYGELGFEFRVQGVGFINAYFAHADEFFRCEKRFKLVFPVFRQVYNIKG